MTKELKNKKGFSIARRLGVNYKGIQFDFINNRPWFFIANDPRSHTSIGYRDFEELRIKIFDVRIAFSNVNTYN